MKLPQTPFPGNSKSDMMFLMRRSIMLAFALLATGPIGYGNSQMIGYYPKGGADIAAEDVSLIQLISNPQAYDGKTIRIIGFLHLEFEGDVIYLHNEDFRYGLTKNGLWINTPRDMTEMQKKAVSDHYVICTAQFVAKMHGHMGMNSGEVTNVSRLQVWDAYQGPPPPPPKPTQK
jgi:hypothetical protein